MTCKTKDTQFELAMELLIENGFDGIASAMTILLNAGHEAGAFPMPQGRTI